MVSLCGGFTVEDHCPRIFRLIRRRSEATPFDRVARDMRMVVVLRQRELFRHTRTILRCCSLDYTIFEAVSLLTRACREAQ
jgi:hypothetical protein